MAQSKSELEAYGKMLMGEGALHVPLNFIVQPAGHNSIGFVGTSKFGDPTHPLQFESRATHQLILCDAIIRPHLVIESSHWKGTGLAGLITCEAMYDVDQWVRRTGNVLLKTR